jgi:hypothetical protein
MKRLCLRVLSTDGVVFGIWCFVQGLGGVYLDEKLVTVIYTVIHILTFTNVGHMFKS